MAKKLSIVEKYEAIIDKCSTVLSEQEINFLRSRQEIASRKNANRTMTKTQIENEGFKKDILAAMADNESYTASDLMRKVGSISNQKVSSLLRQLRLEGLVHRDEIKGRSWFTKL